MIIKVPKRARVDEKSGYSLVFGTTYSIGWTNNDNTVHFWVNYSLKWKGKGPFKTVWLEQRPVANSLARSLITALPL